MKRRSRHSAFSQNHQRSWLWGKHAVIEALKSQRWPVLECVISNSVEEALLCTVQQQCLDRDIPLRLEQDDRLKQLTNAPDHQGMTARMGPYPYLTFDDLLLSKSQQLLMLDRIQDAFNFGSLIRCAVQFGFDSILVGQKSQSSVTPHVARASAGAIHHCAIYQLETPARNLLHLKEQGYKLWGTRMQQATQLTQCRFPVSTVLMIGSEAQGLSEELSEVCDEFVTIPTTNRIDSLNAAVAGGIVMYEYYRQHSNS